jgi:hypothetical protein
MRKRGAIGAAVPQIRDLTHCKRTQPGPCESCGRVGERSIPVTDQGFMELCERCIISGMIKATRTGKKEPALPKGRGPFLSGGAVETRKRKH